MFGCNIRTLNMLLIGFGPFDSHCKPQNLLQTQNNSLLKITIGLRSGRACDESNTLLKYFSFSATFQSLNQAMYRSRPNWRLVSKHKIDTHNLYSLWILCHSYMYSAIFVNRPWVYNIKNTFHSPDWTSPLISMHKIRTPHYTGQNGKSF